MGKSDIAQADPADSFEGFLTPDECWVKVVSSAGKVRVF